MMAFIRRIVQLAIALGVLVIAVFIVGLNSDKLATYRVSLQCTWSENSPNARNRIDWPDDLVNTFQIREDWINGTLMSYTIASGIEGGVKEERIFEDPKKYWKIESGNTFKATTTYNRETLMHRMTIEWNTGETSWVGGPCKVISASTFNQEKRKAIAELKAKQKI